MDIKTLAEHLDQMPMYPYFTVCYITVCTLNVRSDMGQGEFIDISQSFISIRHSLIITTRLIILLKKTSSRLLGVYIIMHILEHNLGKLFTQRARNKCTRKHSTGTVGNSYMVYYILFTI